MSKYLEEQVAFSDKRENDGIGKLLEIITNHPNQLTQTEALRLACQHDLFFAVRKLGPFFPVLIKEHNDSLSHR